ncbi:hypothetical protein EIK77_005112 [Talaromyces pinophilus]|nr:hypothetical protein EIK77_005112 [Talaromyces pinophilus]
MEDVDPPPSFSEYISGLFGPAYWGLTITTDYAIVVSETIFRRGQLLAPILRSSQVRDEAFGRFWIEFAGPQDVTINDEGVLDISKLRASGALIPPLLKKARGVVLDIGPGTGTQMPFFIEPAAKNVSAIYGPEPCVGLHGELRKRIIAHGLESKYHILSTGAEKQQLVDALQREGVQVNDEEGVFDTIVCIRVLCSVPDPEQTIAGLYSLLRPGGQMLIVEHVANPYSLFGRKGGDFFSKVMQTVYMALGWRYYVGDCHLNRDTETYLRKAAEKDGGWKSFELERRFAKSTLPYISGVLTKKG